MLVRTRATGLWRPQRPAVLNRDCAQAQNLIGWWPAGPTQREIATDTGNNLSRALPELITGAHGVNFGSAMRHLSSPMGIVPAALGNISGTAFEVPTGRFSFPTSEATVACWLRLENAVPTFGNGFPFRILPSANESHYTFSDGNAYIGELSTDRALNGFAPRSDVDRTQWHLITLTSRSGTNNYRFFQNGKLAAQGTRGGFPSLASPGKVFVDVQGWACDFRLYNRGLSDAEVWALYDPQTRWSIYWQPHRTYLFVGAGGAGGQTISASAAVATWAAPSATVVPGSVTVSANAATSTWGTPTATVRPVVVLAASTATASWATPNATVSASVSIAANKAIATWAAPSATVAATVRLTPNASVASWALPNATVVPGARTISANAAAATWGLPSASVAGAAVTIPASPATSTWALHASTVRATITVVSSAAAAAWGLPGTSVIPGAFTRTASPAIATWALPAATLVGGAQPNGPLRAVAVLIAQSEAVNSQVAVSRGIGDLVEESRAVQTLVEP